MELAVIEDAKCCCDHKTYTIIFISIQEFGDDIFIALLRLSRISVQPYYVKYLIKTLGGWFLSLKSLRQMLKLGTPGLKAGLI